jgi:hypothetical protein
MGGERDGLERAYQTLDAALQAKGPERHRLLEEALGLWRLARYARGEMTPAPPSDDPPSEP